MGRGAGCRATQTLDLAIDAKQAIAERADQREREEIRARADLQATTIILDRHRDEWAEERDMIITVVAEPDHASLWEQ